MILEQQLANAYELAVFKTKNSILKNKIIKLKNAMTKLAKSNLERREEILTESINWRKLNVQWLKYKWPIIVSLIIILFMAYPQRVFALPWITDNKEVLKF